MATCTEKKDGKRDLNAAVCGRTESRKLHEELQTEAWLGGNAKGVTGSEPREQMDAENSVVIVDAIHKYVVPSSWRKGPRKIIKKESKSKAGALNGKMGMCQEAEGMIIMG